MMRKEPLDGAEVGLSSWSIELRQPANGAWWRPVSHDRFTLPLEVAVGARGFSHDLLAAAIEERDAQETITDHFNPIEPGGRTISLRS